MKMVLILVGGTLVVALGGAFAIFKMMSGSSDKAAAEAAVEKPAAHGEVEAKGGGHGAVAETGAIADLDPFIVNLSDSPEVRYLKVTMKMELDREDAADEIKARTPQIRDAFWCCSRAWIPLRSARLKANTNSRRSDSAHQRPAAKKSGKSAYFTDFVIQ